MPVIRCFSCERNIDVDSVEMEHVNGHDYCPNCLDKPRYYKDLLIDNLNKGRNNIVNDYPVSSDDPAYQKQCEIYTYNRSHSLIK